MRTLFVLFTLSLFLGCLPKDGAWSDFGESSYALGIQDVPLSVCFGTGIDGGIADSLSQAVDSWNDAAGCKVFESQRRGCVMPDVVVKLGETRRNPYTGARIDGETWFNKTQRVAFVKLNTPGTITWNYIIFLHELGHVLGLDHDRWERSVMKPGAHAPRSRLDVDRGPPWPIISHQDRKLVHNRFCR